MNCKEITLSIIIPVYNKDPWLKNQLDSILSQELTDFECILVDDGSTDRSGVICDEYSEKYSQFRTIHQTNAGVSVARNEGLKLAKGRYVCFVDADDEMCTDMYSSLTRFADDEQLDIAICGTDVRIDGKTTQLLYGTEQKYVQSREESVYDFLREGKFTYGACNKIYRRESMKGIFYDPEYKINEDKWFMLCALLRTNRIGIWDHPFYIYHIRKNSASTAKFTDRFFDIRIIAERITDVIEATYPHMLPMAYKSEINKQMELLRRMCQARVCKQYPEQIGLIRNRVCNKGIYNECKHHLKSRIRLERWVFEKMPKVYIYSIPILYKLMGR